VSLVMLFQKPRAPLFHRNHPQCGLAPAGYPAVAQSY
jgi:hypothetical protein